MYHYKESGLKNIWLKNGYRTNKTPYGDGVTIEDIEDLHLEIAKCICLRTKHMTGAQLRFVRKEIGFTQKRTADMLGTDEQSVARWEKSGRVPKTADRLLRAIFIELAVKENLPLSDLINRMNEKDHEEMEKITLQLRKGDWSAQCA